MEKVQTGFRHVASLIREKPISDRNEMEERTAESDTKAQPSRPIDVEEVGLIQPGTRLPEPPFRKVRKDRLINKINFVNFQDGNLMVVFKHKKYAQTRSVQATPQPCGGDVLTCTWREGVRRSFNRYHRFDHILVPDGTNLLRIDADLLSLDEAGLSIRLPEYGQEISSRKIARHCCEGITSHLVQNSTVFAGTLLDFNAVSFRVLVHAVPPQTFQWLNPASNLCVIFTEGRQTLYTGDCRILSQNGGQSARDYVLEPANTAVQRFKPKQYRSQRHRVVPSPDLVFQHPFTRKVTTLKVIDLSGSGFSVEEDAHNAVLLPGLMLPEVELSFANSLRFKCRAQVIYRQYSDEDPGRVKCGITILDMDIAKHVQLVALLQQAENRHSYICNKVDLDALWNFFFETGFIYPHKYSFIQKNKEQIKATYEKLYTRNPSIARHFIYQDKGRILAHMAMVRFYENTWLIHHHAARNNESARAGLMVLNQISNFGNDSHRLYSIHLDYFMCYYRPDNKFPRRVFGGAVRNIKNLKACSEDTFAYIHFNAGRSDIAALDQDWELSKVRDEDLQELKTFYEFTSGGLMLTALNLEPGNTEKSTIASEYRKLGFKHQRSIFSLKYQGTLKAVFMRNLSDIGLNLSDLTNSIKMIVVDPDGLTWNITESCLNELIRDVDYSEMPVMIYPCNFVDMVNVPIEKKYTLWTLHTHDGSDDYLRYLSRMLRFIKT